MESHFGAVPWAVQRSRLVEEVFSPPPHWATVKPMRPAYFPTCPTLTAICPRLVNELFSLRLLGSCAVKDFVFILFLSTLMRISLGEGAGCGNYQAPSKRGIYGRTWEKPCLAQPSNPFLVSQASVQDPTIKDCAGNIPIN